jgi:hypothetical protein
MTANNMQDIIPAVTNYTGGIDQLELVNFGALLTEAGVPTDMHARVMGRLQKVANEATMRGAMAILNDLKLSRATEIDANLRAVRNTTYAQQNSMGYVRADRIVAYINSMLTTPEPMPRSQN